ncbi:transposable element Tcb1 transposase [Trichonephila clavipes]|nr:transposable element Tcb1 transposase [Trichonephila clavipes]
MNHVQMSLFGKGKWITIDANTAFNPNVMDSIPTWIVAYPDCALSFREIGSRVGRNQTTAMWICDRWMQEDTTDRRGRSHPPQCTSSSEDRQIVRIAVTDHSVTSRHIESVTHHSVSASII